LDTTSDMPVQPNAAMEAITDNHDNNTSPIDKMPASNLDASKAMAMEA
jgi:hypothetical protein